jgi:formate--tetrahydrofolate ligase
VVVSIEKNPGKHTFVYEESLPLWDKIKAIATKIYCAADIDNNGKVVGLF